MRLKKKSNQSFSQFHFNSFQILLVESENTYNELIFSPKQLNRYSSRVVYYEPKNETVETSTQVPWEDVLKETVILTLNNDEKEFDKSR